MSRAFTSLRVPNYRRYFAGQVVSLAGNWMQIVAETWLVLKLTNNGALVGLAAVMFAGRIQSASPLIATGVELNVIAAVLLGGTSFLGGSSSMLGTAIGVTFIAVLQNGLDLFGVQALWQGVVTGSVLILAVWVDRIRRPG